MFPTRLVSRPAQRRYRCREHSWRVPVPSMYTCPRELDLRRRLWHDCGYYVRLNPLKSGEPIMILAVCRVLRQSGSATGRDHQGSVWGTESLIPGCGTLK